MQVEFSKKQMSIAVAAALATIAIGSQIQSQRAVAAKTPGTYLAGDIHNHTTCSDGSISMQKLVSKSTDKTDGIFGLDWFVQAGHGGNGNRNCSLVEDATLATPAYPFVSGQSPSTTWASSIGSSKLLGDNAATSGNMWRWQSVQQVQYQVMEYLNRTKDLPIFLGIESVVAGHEHTSMSVITGQMPAVGAPSSGTSYPGYVPFGGYVAAGNADALAQWSYCFDRGDTDTSRGAANQWNCAVPGSNSASNVSWNSTAQKLIPAGGTGSGDRGHLKTVEAVKWMAAFHPTGSYYIPAHLERAGQFNPNGNNGFNVEHLRNLNNAGPNIAFGMETQPGHGASANRGEYQPVRQTINGVPTDSVGTTTYGGTGVYGAQIGGVWDALLGEGRNFWFLASSDWHNRGTFGADDRRSKQDFYPGEYQRNYTMVRNNGAKLTPQMIVDGLRTGNTFASSGQLIDRLAFVACASYAGPAFRSNASVEALAVAAATNGTDIDRSGCATMGEKLVVRPGAELVVTIVVRDPAGTNYSPYTFPNPSLAQIGVTQPMNAPVLDHIDLIRGMVSGYKTPGAADYSGAWPANSAWLNLTTGETAGLAAVPAAAKNTTTALLKTFSASAGSSAWTPVVSTVDGTTFLKMTIRISAVQASQYLRLRGTNLPASVPFETDANGNPLTDLWTNANDATKLRIPCTYTVPAPTVATEFNSCPTHMVAATGTGNPILGQKASSYDVAAWADLWFYSNPIYIEVTGSTVVAGVK